MICGRILLLLGLIARGVEWRLLDVVDRRWLMIWFVLILLGFGFLIIIVGLVDLIWLCRVIRGLSALILRLLVRGSRRGMVLFIIR